MKNQESVVNRWKLGGLVIRQYTDGSYSWALYAQNAHMQTDEEWEAGWGDCWIKGDVLMMGSLSTVDNLRKNHDDPDDPVKFLPTLPKWDKTKYFIVEDASGIRVMDCVTGALVTYRQIPNILAG